MNIRVSIISASVLGLVFIAHPLAAPNEPENPVRAARIQDLLAKYDANKNGKLDPEEVERVGKDRMAKWDANKDGKVDMAERKALRAASREQEHPDKK